jgi:IS1 family transposase
MFGKTGSSAQLKLHDWQHGQPRFRCQICGSIISASSGTAYAGIRTDLEIYRRGTKTLAEGLSIRATSRLIEVDKDTVNHWLPTLGLHSQGVMNYFFRNLHLEECQLDELWTFIYKKEKQLTTLEKLAEVYGDAWVWIAFSPICKIVPAWVVGKRTLSHARRLVFRLKSASDGQIPFFTSDELPHYADALLEVYGQQVQPLRNGMRGRFPRVPCAASSSCSREARSSPTRIVYGTTQQVQAALEASPVSQAINTYGVERNNLTIRQHSRRMSRKVMPFQKTQIILNIN